MPEFNMLFHLPHFPTLFEIPDEWWEEAGMERSVHRPSAYLSTDENAPLIALREIVPPFRLPDTPKDFKGFDRQRMVRILKGIALNEPLPPIELQEISIFYVSCSYCVRDGLHRYYAAAAAGFDEIPALIVEHF
ncbi:hypothetical protein [Xanthobacter autotrophicus]|uniref:hypothetical protein n=1 Tax=Xanthobacter autotrophicus TaxID=280 RepID=UPI00372C0326